MTANIICFSVILFITIASTAQTTTKKKNLEEAKKAIAASNAIYFESFAKNDSSIFINCYSEDACIMAPFASQSCGREMQPNFSGRRMITMD